MGIIFSKFSQLLKRLTDVSGSQTPGNLLTPADGGGYVWTAFGPFLPTAGGTIAGPVSIVDPTTNGSSSQLVITTPNFRYTQFGVGGGGSFGRGLFFEWDNSSLQAHFISFGSGGMLVECYAGGNMNFSGAANYIFDAPVSLQNEPLYLDSESSAQGDGSGNVTHTSSSETFLGQIIPGAGIFPLSSIPFLNLEFASGGAVYVANAGGGSPATPGAVSRYMPFDLDGSLYYVPLFQ